MAASPRGGNTPFLLLGVLLGVLTASGAFAQSPGNVARGLYIAKAAGCVGCHTEDKPDAEPFAGGRALETPFGTFFGPNITPHPQAGIGKWSEQDFVRALHLGVRPDGAHYYPAFPYPSFTRITEQDLRDLWAYLRSLAPSAKPNKPHELRFPFGWRWLAGIWNMVFFTPERFAPDPARNATVNRGAYLANALGHCGECHTPRNFLGVLQRDRQFAGAKLGDGPTAPNLTPTRLKDTSDAELKEFLLSAMTPDGDVAAESMAEVVRNTTSQLSPQDMDALIAYLRSLPPLPDATK